MFHKSWLTQIAPKHKFPYPAFSALNKKSNMKSALNKKSNMAYWANIEVMKIQVSTFIFEKDEELF